MPFQISPLGHQDREIIPAAIPPPGPLIYMSGMTDTNRLPKATRITLTKLMSALGHLGLAKSDLIQLKAFFQPMSEATVVRKAIVDFFGGTAPPTVFVEWITPRLIRRLRLNSLQPPNLIRRIKASP